MIIMNDEAIGHAVAAAVDGSFAPGRDRVIARVERGVVLAGVIYQQYTGRSVQMHVAAWHPNWLSRDFLWVLFNYPFEQLGCKVVIAAVATSNFRAMKLDLKLGFKAQITIPDVFDDGAGITMMTMRRDECRWLNLKPRQLQSGNVDNG